MVLLSLIYAYTVLYSKVEPCYVRLFMVGKKKTTRPFDIIVKYCARESVNGLIILTQMYVIPIVCNEHKLDKGLHYVGITVIRLCQNIQTVLFPRHSTSVKLALDSDMFFFS